jgi:hypothetical protein
MKNILSIAFLLILTLTEGQDKPLTYYLPDIDYDPEIPTPEEVLGYQVGDWHVSHDQSRMYMKAVTDASERMVWQEYARSYEGRPLYHLIITSPENHQRLEEIRAEHLRLTDPGQSENLDISSMPAVLYQGFSIHGNEPSGGNAALLVAYYLAAGNSEDINNLLENTVILFDPVYNPDGFQRFSTWANMHKNENITSDPADREYREVWPRGRTNHYWFDLNRDWLLVQHPESQGRIQRYHEWKPNVLTDHHEMGTSSTFFFMPGEPTRTHPLTPPKNQELTGKIGDFHARALDQIGSLYYSKEGYDDFYYGKGSTYPDANGGIGILFEQASSRGHSQETDMGTLTFPFTIRNQVTTALSTQKAVVELREELLTFQRDFFKKAQNDASTINEKAYIFGEPGDKGKVDRFIEILRRHQVQVYQLSSDRNIRGKRYNADNSFVVPTGQSQLHLIRAIFETQLDFEDSLFYDVSTWTLPLAFNLQYDALDAKSFNNSLLGTEITGLRPERQSTTPDKSNYAYLLRWDDYFSSQALYYLLNKGLKAKVGMTPFVLNGINYDAGTIMIPVQGQEHSADDLYELIKDAMGMTGVSIESVGTGLTETGIDLGSRDFEPLRLPKVALLVGDGVSSYEAGEAWHLLDNRLDMTISKLDVDRLRYAALDRYNVLVMVSGRYSELIADKIKSFVKDGGTLITLKNAGKWASDNGISGLQVRNQDESSNEPKPYGKLDRERGSRVIGGAIVRTQLDLTHPLAFGFVRSEVPMFRRGTLCFEPTKNAYATPLRYADRNVVWSGYVKTDQEPLLAGSAGIVVTGTGSGRVISFADNPNFRAFWYGSNRLFMNAMFFGHTISGSAVER